MSQVVHGISEAIQGLVNKAGSGVKDIQLMKDASAFPVTLSQRAPSKDTKMVYQGSCTCGAVHLEIDHGELPKVQQICHCGDCQRWHSADMVTEILFPAKNGTSVIYVVKGAENVKFVAMSSKVRRAMCTECGTRICNLAAMGMAATFPAIFPDWPVNLQRHLYWKESVPQARAAARDGLPKFMTRPTDEGGDGELAPKEQW